VLYGNIITTRPCTRRTPGTHDPERTTRPGHTLHDTVWSRNTRHTVRHATHKHETIRSLGILSPGHSTHSKSQNIRPKPG